MFPYYSRYHPFYQYPTNNYPDTVYLQGRVFTSRPGLMQRMSWIERGADGRAYYVKQKSAVPSLRQKFAEAINDLRSRNPFINGTPVSAPTSPAQPAAPAPLQTQGPSSRPHSRASTPRRKSSLKQKSQPQPEMAERSRTPTHSQTPQPQPQPPSQCRQSQPHHHFPPFPSFIPYIPPQVGNDNDGQNQQNTALVPSQLAHYAAPHPRMYPYVLPGNQALTHQPVGRPPPANTADATFNPAHTTVPNAPPIAPPRYGPSNPAQYAINPMTMNPDDLKFKCSICGRFRSARYQWKHRVPVGQLPGPTICRSCRQAATDSEDEDTDSYEERDYRAHTHRRNRSRGRASRPRSRARSSSRPKRTFDFDYYASREPEASSSDSDMSVEVRPRRRKSRSRRAQSPNVELVRYVDGPAVQPRQKSRRRKIIYVEDHRREPDLSGEDDELDVRYVAYPSRSRIISRPASPARRLLPRQFSDPPIRGAPYVTERRVYYEEPPSSRPAKHISPSPGLHERGYHGEARTSSRPRRHYSYGPHETTDEEHHYYDPAYERMPRGRMRGGGNLSRSRSRSRVSIDEGAEAGPLNTYLPLTSNPPAPHRRRSSSLTYNEVGGKEVMHDSHPRSSSRHRRKLHRDSEVEVMEEDATPPDDYDMYDNNGMRIRVREI